MNPYLKSLQPYPFAKLRSLFEGVTPNPELPHINLGIGEPKHEPPSVALNALNAGLNTIAQYPSVHGQANLRETISSWATKRFQLSSLRTADQILPVNGTREALFSIAQVICGGVANATVFAPNPFYQIYEGAALMAGAKLKLLPCLAEYGHQPDYISITDSDWDQCDLLYICNPGNPAGGVLSKETLVHLINKARLHDFVLVADECYSELYSNEDAPPFGLLQVCAELGDHEYTNCLIFQSLSKRSNLPGMRSGFVAGDSKLIQPYLQYRTYHGCTMPIYHQEASSAAWADETHVVANRALYRAKFSAVLPILSPYFDITQPPGGFYLWLPTPDSDEAFARAIFEQEHITVLPGSYLGRSIEGCNPGSGYVRAALVAKLDECVAAAHRIARYMQSQGGKDA